MADAARGQFTGHVGENQELAECSRILYAKPLNERLIILLQKKNGILASIF